MKLLSALKNPDMNTFSLSLRLVFVFLLVISTAAIPASAWGQSTRPVIDVQPLEDPHQATPPVEAPRAPTAPARMAIVDKRVILQALDKITARVSKIEAEIGRPVRFGTLDIVVHACSKRPPEESPETSVFLEITEIRENEEAVTQFIGWMFASSPALSALEHPVYDVWVLDCLDKTS